MMTREVAERGENIAGIGRGHPNKNPYLPPPARDGGVAGLRNIRAIDTIARLGNVLPRGRGGRERKSSSGGELEGWNAASNPGLPQPPPQQQLGMAVAGNGALPLEGPVANQPTSKRRSWTSLVGTGRQRAGSAPGVVEPGGAPDTGAGVGVRG